MSTPDRQEHTVQWFAHYEMAARLDDDQAAELHQRVFTLALTDNPAGGRWCRLTIGVEAADHQEASRKAHRAYTRIIATLPTGAHLDPPYRVTVEAADAPTGTDLLSTAAVAARLGVSDARVRQLSARPDFPRPANIPGLSGAVYPAAAVDAWATTWDRDAKGGRPRATPR